MKGKTHAGDRVFPNYSVNPGEEQLPCIMVYPDTEGADKYGDAPREFELGLGMRIEIVAAGPEVDEEGNYPNPDLQTSVEDLLDYIWEQVVCELSKDETLGGVCDDSMLTNTEFQFEGEGGQPIGSCRMSYLFTYYRLIPESVDKQLGTLDDHTELGLTWKLKEDSSDDDTTEATDTVAVPTE